MRKLREENATLRTTSTAAGDFGALGKRRKGAGTYTKETADKHSRSLWRINLELCGGSEAVLFNEIAKKVDNQSKHALANFVLDNSIVLKKIVTERHHAFVKNLEKTEHHQARSLMATMAAKLGYNKQHAITSMTHKNLTLASSSEDYGDSSIPRMSPIVHDVPGLGEMISERRLMSKQKHKIIYSRIQENNFENWADSRYSDGRLVDSSWLPKPEDGARLGLGNFEVAMVNLEELIRSQVKIMLENPQINEQLQWVYADQEVEKNMHFVFAVAIDGFPRTKHKTSTEAILQCLNLMGGINQSDFNRIIAIADLDETSDEFDKIAGDIDRQMTELKNKGGLEMSVVLPSSSHGSAGGKYVYTETTVKFTVDFFFKADLKYFAHALGQMPASAKQYGIFMKMSKEEAARLSSDNFPKMTTLEDRERWYSLVQEAYEAKMKATDQSREAGSKEPLDEAGKNKILNDIANQHGGQKGPVLMKNACNGMADGMHAEANFAKNWSERLNSYANGQDLFADGALCPTYGIGPVQQAFHSSLEQNGLGRYAEAFRNQKSRDEGKRKQGLVRYTGVDAIKVMKTISAHTTPLKPAAGKDGPAGGEPALDFDRRVRLRLEMIMVARMSEVYSKYTVSESDIENLQKMGYHLLDLWKISNKAIGLNDSTIAFALPQSIKQHFKYFRIGDGKTALGGGIVGSAQGAEAKHADSKLQAAATSGRPGWAVRMLWNEAIRAFGVLMVPTDDPLRANRAQSTLSFRYPPGKLFEGNNKYSGCCTSRLCKLTTENKAENNFLADGDGFLSEDLQTHHDPSLSCTGKLNYEPSAFEGESLHFHEDFCCEDCALALDYFRECALQKGRTGIWAAQIKEATKRAVAAIEEGAKVTSERVIGEVADKALEEQLEKEQEAEAAAEEQNKERQRSERGTQKTKNTAEGARHEAPSSFLDDMDTLYGS